MSNAAHLKRAIAGMIQAVIPELNAFGDELANREKRYPELVIVEIDSDRKPFGCGGEAHVVRTPEGVLAARGRLVEESADFRLTLSAPNDREHSGAEIVASLTRRIGELIDEIVHERPLRHVVDPVTGEDQRVIGLRTLGTNDLPPDFTGEPFLFRKAITIRVRFQQAYERPVEHRIDRIDVTNGGIRV